MHLSNLVRQAGVEQNTLCRGGFTRIDMRTDTNIAVRAIGVLRATAEVPRLRFSLKKERLKR